MLVLIDEREIVAAGYAGGFKGEGVSTTGFSPVEFREWVSTAAEHDLGAVEAFLVGSELRGTVGSLVGEGVEGAVHMTIDPRL